MGLVRGIENGRFVYCTIGACSIIINQSCGSKTHLSAVGGDITLSIIRIFYIRRSMPLGYRKRLCCRLIATACNVTRILYGLEVILVRLRRRHSKSSYCQWLNYSRYPSPNFQIFTFVLNDIAGMPGRPLSFPSLMKSYWT